MTQLIEKAFKEASNLPKMEKNIFAQWILDELSSERKWEKAFSESEDVLEMLGDEALSDYGKGKIKLLETDKL